MAVVDELIGKKFGRLTILDKRLPNKVLCECECGLKVVKALHNLTNHKVVDCGTHGNNRGKNNFGRSKLR